MIKSQNAYSSVTFYKKVLSKIDHGDDLGVANLLKYIKSFYNILLKNDLVTVHKNNKRKNYYSDSNKSQDILHIGFNDLTEKFEVISNSKIHMLYSLVMPINIFSESNTIYVSDIEKIIINVLQEKNSDLNAAKVNILSVLKKMILSYEQETLSDEINGDKNNSAIVNYDKNTIHIYSFNELMKFYDKNNNNQSLQINNLTKLLKSSINNESDETIDLHKEKILDIIYQNKLLPFMYQSMAKELPMIKRIFKSSNFSLIQKVSDKYNLDITASFVLVKSLPNYDSFSTSEIIDKISLLIKDDSNIDVLFINLINQNEADLAIGLDKKYNIVNNFSYTVTLNNKSYTHGADRYGSDPNERVLNNKSKAEFDFVKKIKSEFSDRVAINVVLSSNECIYFYNHDLLDFMKDVDADLIYSKFYKKDNILKDYMSRFTDKYSCNNMNDFIAMIDYVNEAIPYYEKAIDKNSSQFDQGLLNNISFN